MDYIKYNAALDLSNYNNSHSLAFHFISCLERSGLRVLEVGCSAGYFGASLRAVGHHVVGVEPDEVSSRQAAAILDEVYCGFIEDFFAANPGRFFDVIVFGDVLEHLVDPGAVLRLARQFLAVDGRVVASVPNVAHASVRAMLLGGDWTYATLGILDRTHLRFYNKRALVALMQDAGFDVEYIQPVILSSQEAAKMCEMKLTPAAVRQVDGIKDDDTLHDFQYVVSAKVGVASQSRVGLLSRKRMLRVVVLSDEPESNITEIRLGYPLRRLAWSGGLSLVFRAFRDFSISNLSWGDVFILQRGYCRKALDAAQMIASSGKPFVYEIDDLLTGIPDFMSHHAGFKRNKAKIESCIKMASMVTVTTDRLGKALKVPDHKVFICPNYARPTADSGLRPAVHDDEGQVTLVVASSDKVVVEFLLNPIKVVMKKYGNRLRLVCIGAISEKFQSAGIVGEFHAILPYDEFGKVVGRLPNPIGIIPLDDSEFSSCKSAIKYFDYTKGGLAVICSNVPPYSDVVTSGEDGVLVPNTDQAWTDGLSALIESASYRNHLSGVAMDRLTKHHSLEVTIDAWSKVFERLAPDGRGVKGAWASVTLPIRIKSELRAIRLRLRDLNRARKARRQIERERANQVA